MKPLNDTDLMPFGKHKGLPLKEVPAEYFHYLWNNGLKTENKPVANYIRSVLPALKKEDPDLIWDK